MTRRGAALKGQRYNRYTKSESAPSHRKTKICRCRTKSGLV